MTDLDETVAAATGDRQDEPDSTTPQLWVCNNLTDDGKICGKSYDRKVQLNGHTTAVHRVTWDGKPTGKPGRKEKDEDPQPKPKAAPKAARQATAGHGPTTITPATRPQVYQQSLATIGVLAHLGAGRWFDDYDLGVWANGTPGLANALNAAGEQNPGLRKACDLILAGGSGGAYVQLFMAAAMIAVPIASHHGVLPENVGQRFIAMSGMMTPTPDAGPGPVAPPAQPPAPGPAPTNRLPVADWSYDEWREVLFASADNPTAQQVMVEMMQGMGVGPTVTTIPDMPGSQPMNIPEEDHRGNFGANGADNTVPTPTD